jgi:hypothetical protein
MMKRWFSSSPRKTHSGDGWQVCGDVEEMCGETTNANAIVEFGEQTPVAPDDIDAGKALDVGNGKQKE